MNDDEYYTTLLLADSSLPTGSFVASSGLESSITHGFTSSSSDSTIAFVRDSLHTYARSALPFVGDAYTIVERFKNNDDGDEDGDGALRELVRLDELYDAMTLHHVARRASKTQGVALLTLHSKGFAPSSSSSSSSVSALVAQLKLLVRKGDTHGHLPICWSVLAASLGLSLDRTQYLHLFLHARSLVSAAVRLNTLGPYSAQHILLHAVRPLVEIETRNSKHLRTALSSAGGVIASEDGPANTWPLGEILAARHDLLHSRIFNS